MAQLKIRKAVFPVAGLGTRFLPATKTVPKEMMPIVDRPLIQYAVDEAIEAGCETLIFVTNRYKHSIADYFDKAYELEQKLEKSGKFAQLQMLRNILPSHVNAVFVTQHEALGLGHAVQCAEAIVGNEPFCVLLPDDLLLNRRNGVMKQLVESAMNSGLSTVAVEEVPVESVSSYGIVEVPSFDGRSGRLTGMVEKPTPENAPSNLAVVGRYVLMPEIFPALRSVTSGAGGEIQLTDAIGKLIGQPGVNAFQFEGTRFDCGTHLGLVEATVRFALDNEKLSAGARAAMETALRELGVSER